MSGILVGPFVNIVSIDRNVVLADVGMLMGEGAGLVPRRRWEGKYGQVGKKVHADHIRRLYIQIEGRQHA